MPPESVDPMASGAPVPGETDVAVIGGGVIGLCTAYELVQRGREVVVIDKARWPRVVQWGMPASSFPAM